MQALHPRLSFSTMLLLLRVFCNSTWILGSSLLLLPKQVIDRDCTWSLWEVLSLLGYLLIPFPCLTVHGGICGTMLVEAVKENILGSWPQGASQFLTTAHHTDSGPFLCTTYHVWRISFLQLVYQVSLFFNMKREYILSSPISQKFRWSQFQIF